MTFLAGTRAVRVFLCFAAAYFLSYAFRAVNAVIAPALMRDVGLSNADLGLLSSAYFVSFACLQLPLGVWLDKYGARRTEAALLLLAAAGAAIFALSTSLLGLWIGRALIGAGVSSCLMAPFKAYRTWYAPARQSQLASWMLVAGTAGALASTMPVAAALPSIGWRGVFWIMSALILMAAAAIFWLLKEVESERATSAAAVAAPIQEQGGTIDGYARIFGNPYFRRMALLGIFNQGTFIALQTLWAGPWMITVLGMNARQTSEILFVFNLSLLFGYIGLGWWAPRHVSHDGKRGWPVERAVTAGLAGTLAVQAAIAAISAPWAWLLWPLLAVFVTVTTLIQTHVSLSFPAALAGRANTAYNLLLFIGAFGVQWGMGLLIDAFKLRGASPAGAMQAAFALCLALQAAALLAFVLNRAKRAPAAI